MTTQPDIDGIRRQMAATIHAHWKLFLAQGIVMVIFGLLVWMPLLLSDPRNHTNWSETAETFAIAGLIDNRVTQVLSKIPGFGDLPIIGHLFSSSSFSP